MLPTVTTDEGTRQWRWQTAADHTRDNMQRKSVFVAFMIGDSVAVCQRLPLLAMLAQAVRAATASSYSSSQS